MPASSQQSPTSGTRADRPRAGGAADLDVVDPRPVQLGQRVDRAGVRAPARAAPRREPTTVSSLPASHAVEGQRQAPVALARDAPVAHVVQPVVHAAADVRRDPTSTRSWRPGHRLADLVDADEPLVRRAGRARALAAPADGIRCAVQLVREERPRSLQQRRRSASAASRDVAAREPAEAVDVVALRRRPARSRRGRALAELVVLGAAAGRDVDDAGAFFGVDLLPRDHAVLDAGCDGQVVEGRLELAARRARRP